MIRLACAADVAIVSAIVEEAYAVYLARNGKIPGPMRDDYAVLIAERRVHVLEDIRRKEMARSPAWWC